jgi:hypothetical protein
VYLAWHFQNQCQSADRAPVCAFAAGERREGANNQADGGGDQDHAGEDRVVHGRVWKHWQSSISWREPLKGKEGDSATASPDFVRGTGKLSVTCRLGLGAGLSSDRAA